MTAFVTTIATPVGPFSLAVDRDGALLATAFGEIEVLRTRFDAAELGRDSDRTRTARAQIEAYFAGERSTFALSLAPRGTAFQRRVWRELAQIPLGETRSYGELAASIGQPGAARAVGRANATNPVCLVVPCHRVIGADGSLTGFAFGEPIKRWLLAHERKMGETMRATAPTLDVALECAALTAAAGSLR